MAAPVHDLVVINKIETQFLTAPEKAIQHVYRVSDRAIGRLGNRREERWRKERLLGRGAFGAVYLQRCTYGPEEKIQQLRAVKKCEKKAYKNFLREVEAALIFSQEQYRACFVRSYGWFEDDNNIFIAMEYLELGELSNFIKSPLPENEAKIITLQLSEGLEFMHKLGFTHRDLKPANILVKRPSPHWWVKIADLGLSKRAAKDAASHLKTVAGTRMYAAPEVFLNPTDEYTSAVDIWSLGIITYEILTRERVFNDEMAWRRYLANDLPFPTNALLKQQVSSLGCKFVKRMLEPAPDRRPKADECSSNPWLRVDQYPEPEEAVHTSNNASSGLQTSVYESDEEPLKAWTSAAEPTKSNQTAKLPRPPPLPPRTSVAQSRTNSQASSSQKLSSISVTSSDQQSAYTEPSASLGHESESTLEEDYGSTAIMSRVEPDKLTGLPATLKGHGDTVFDVRFSADGRLLASCSFDFTVKLWDVETRTLLKTWESPKYFTMSKTWRIGFSHDGKRLGAGIGKQVKLYNTTMIDDLSEITLEGHTAEVMAIAFSAPGNFLATGGADKTIIIWNAATGDRLETLKGFSKITDLEFSLDETMLASCGWDSVVMLWRVPRNLGVQPTPKWSTTPAIKLKTNRASPHVCSVAFSPDSTRLAASADYGTAFIWDTATGGLLHELKHQKSHVNGVAFSHNGKLLATASMDKTVNLWNPFTGELLKSLEGSKRTLKAVAFSPVNMLLASASKDNNIRLYDTSDVLEAMDTLVLPAVLQGHHSGVTSVAFSPDGTMLASATLDCTIHIWDSKKASPRLILRGPELQAVIAAVAFSYDSKFLAAASRRTISIWDPISGARIAAFSGHSENIRSLAFSPTKLWLAATSDFPDVIVYQNIKWAGKTTVLRPTSRVSQIAFSPNGEQLAMACADLSVHTWNLGDPVTEIVRRNFHAAPVTSVTYSPDGDIVASGDSTGYLQVYNLEHNKSRTSSVLRTAVNSLAFSPDGKHLVTASSEAIVRVWDGKTLTLKKNLDGHKGAVSCVAYSPDGKMIASGSADETVRLWDAGTVPEPDASPKPDAVKWYGGSVNLDSKTEFSVKTLADKFNKWRPR